MVPPTTSQFESTCGGVVIVTISTSVTPTTTSLSIAQSSSNPNPFWSNKGAVAGVFTAIGLIGLALATLLITFVRRRRRRATKSDKEIAATAGVATFVPLDDSSGRGGDGYGFSDKSHGIAEMPQSDPRATGGVVAGGGTAFETGNRKESEIDAPDVVVVGAGNLARGPSTHTPSHTPTGPIAQELCDPTTDISCPRSASTEGPVLEPSTGLSGTGEVAMANDTGNAQVNLRPSENTHHIHESSGDGEHPSLVQPGYESDVSTVILARLLAMYLQHTRSSSARRFVIHRPPFFKK